MLQGREHGLGCFDLRPEAGQGADGHVMKANQPVVDFCHRCGVRRRAEAARPGDVDLLPEREKDVVGHRGLGQGLILSTLLQPPERMTDVLKRQHAMEFFLWLSCCSWSCQTDRRPVRKCQMIEMRAITSSR